MELNDQTDYFKQRDLERAPQPQDARKEKIAQGNKNQLAECCY